MKYSRNSFLDQQMLNKESEVKVRLTPCRWRSRLQGRQQSRWQFSRLPCKEEKISHITISKGHTFVNTSAKKNIISVTYLRKLRITD